MQSRIALLPEKKLVGISTRMSHADNKTFTLWNTLMPRRREIANAGGSDLYSVEEFERGHFARFDPTREFTKWAAIEVMDFTAVPDGMEQLTIPAGTYAVFVHRGPANEGARTYEQIFRSWLPSSEYDLDHRPHFALMGEKYKHNEEDSEEEIWIPVKPKSGL